MLTYVLAERGIDHEEESQNVNTNRATLVVVRKMVAYLLAVDRAQRDFVSAEDHRVAVA